VPAGGRLRQRQEEVLPNRVGWGLGFHGDEPPLAGRLYALSTAGTLFYPEVDGTLRPEAFASLGLGVDDAR